MTPKIGRWVVRRQILSAGSAAAEGPAVEDPEQRRCTPTWNQPAGGTFEEPRAPVYVGGEHFSTLRGDHIAEEFKRLLDDCVVPPPGADPGWRSRRRCRAAMKVRKCLRGGGDPPPVLVSGGGLCADSNRCNDLFTPFHVVQIDINLHIVREVHAFGA
jgi:hypothetical protein